MDSILKGLKHDFNLAVENYNIQDYVGFFRNIRPAIELFCKLIIYDTIGNENIYNKLLNGEKTLSKYMDKYSITSTNNKPVTGSALVFIFPKAYFYKNPDVMTSRFNMKFKKIKAGLESYSSSLNYWYSVASEIGNHTDGSVMNVEKQAHSCAVNLDSFLDFLSSYKIVSDTVLQSLIELEKISFISNDLKKAEKEIQEKKEILKEKEQTISEQDKILLLMKEQLAEVEKDRLEALNKTSEVESQLKIKLKEIEDLKVQLSEHNIDVDENTNDTVSPLPISTKTAISLKNKLKEKIAIDNWDVEEESMDDDQLDLIEDTLDKSMLVSGCAGSGKSVIAMHKAEQIAEAGFDVILIAYTKSLNGFMQCGSKKVNHYRFFYHYQWLNAKMPSADYIIVDEIQDFERDEIQQFINAAKKYYLFFGDSAQSIYSHFGKKTLSIEEISLMTGLKPLNLYNNYRLPRPVAKITQNYVGVDVLPYADKVYQNKEKSLPYFIRYNDFDSQMGAVNQIINIHPDSSVGILLPSNTLVQQTCEKLNSLGIDFEYKFQVENNAEKKMYGNLDFSSNLPKVMTYHSAKGLQFDVVILPMYQGALTEDSRKALYVAMTRTMHKLYVLYSTPELKSPLDVPSILYKKSL